MKTERGWMQLRDGTFHKEQFSLEKGYWSPVEVVIRPADMDDAVMAVVKAARAMFLDADDVSLDELEARINFVGGAIKALDALEGEG